MKSLIVIGLLISQINLAISATPDPARERRRTPIVKVCEKTSPCIVNISGQRTVTTSPFRGFDFPQFDLWGPRYQRNIHILGSGFMSHAQGYLVTNAHVIEGTDSIKAISSDGGEFTAEIISADTSHDLAILRVDANEPLPAISLGCSNDLMIGETVIAIGNPYGYANTVTTGIISATDRDIQVNEDFWLRGLIQTDAPINPGNSGGPLLNINGELIGVNTVVKADAQNIGFAIPVDGLINNISQLLMPEKLRRVRLGLTMGRMCTIRQHTGLEIDTVSDASPADDQGLRAQDLILELDGQALTSIIDFYVKLMNKEIGQPIAMTYIRPSDAPLTEHKVKLKLAPRPLPDGRRLAHKYFQMTISELTDAIARQFNFEGAYPVLIITDVSRGGMAQEIGLRAGDLILEVNGKTVRNLRDLSLEMEKVSNGDIVEFEIMRIGIGRFGQYQRRYTTQLRATASRALINMY